MFTGLVEELGRIAAIEGSAHAVKLTVEAQTVLEGVRLGDSIAVNGVCLTVTSFGADRFTADVMPETLKKTNLGRLKRGEAVNLERAMALGDRMGGHLVTGHIDGTGVVNRPETHANAVLFRIQAPPDLLKYMVPRGSVAIDGISLTLVDVTPTDFAVSIIPHTLAHTNLKDKKPGDVVNLECDIIGKYVERLLTWRREPDTGGGSRLSLDFLREHGFS